MSIENELLHYGILGGANILPQKVDNIVFSNNEYSIIDNRGR